MSDTPIVEPTASEDAVHKPNVTLTDPCKSELEANVATNLAHHVAIMRHSMSEFAALAEQYPNINFTETNVGKEWAEAIKDASNNLMSGDVFGSRVQDPQTDWQQFVGNNGDRLRAGRPSLGMGGETRLTGEAAIIKATAVLGLGAIIQIPLWHTGIWVSFKVPQNSALLELDRRIANEKIVLGRVTNGMVFSNTSIYLQSYLVNFALAHIYDCSLKDINPDRLKRIILSTDIPTLIMGLACTIWPAGYPLVQPCIDNPDKCQHVTREKLNLTKLFWTDNMRLTSWQRTHMAGRNRTYTVDDVKRYQSEHSYNTRVTCKPSDDVTLRLKVPTVGEYEDAGFAWVDGIVRMVDDAFGVTLRGDERNDYINQQAKATSLRQFSHWVGEINVGDGQVVVDDNDTINGLLSTFSNRDSLVTSIFDAIGKFIDDTTISLIAVPKYNCPVCGKPQTELETKHPHLIPQDAMSIFFTLHDQRTSEILSTER